MRKKTKKKIKGFSKKTYGLLKHKTSEIKEILGASAKYFSFKQLQGLQSIINNACKMPLKERKKYTMFISADKFDFRCEFGFKKICNIIKSKYVYAEYMPRNVALIYQISDFVDDLGTILQKNYNKYVFSKGKKAVE